MQQQIGSGTQMIEDIGIDGQGRIVAGGIAGSPGFWVGRFTASGGLDSSFGDVVNGEQRSGWTRMAWTGVHDFAALDLMGDGRIVLGGTASGVGGNFMVFGRLQSNGTPDATFDEDGKAALQTQYTWPVHDVVADGQGRIVVGGRSSIGVNHRLTIGRLTAAGALDTSFGDSGWTIVDRTATDYAEERVISLAIQADGKIVAGAHTSAGKLTLLRLWGDQAGRVYYLHDANHNVTGLADASGQVLERYGYGAYGTVTVYDPQWQERPAGSACGNTVLYGGYQWDAETALYCVRNRYYHPSLGRWISRDPIGYKGGSNLYGYSSRPLDQTDPSGHAPDGPRMLFSDEHDGRQLGSSWVAKPNGTLVEVPDTGGHVAIELWAKGYVAALAAGSPEPEADAMVYAASQLLDRYGRMPLWRLNFILGAVGDWRHDQQAGVIKSSLWWMAITQINFQRGQGAPSITPLKSNGPGTASSIRSGLKGTGPSVSPSPNTSGPSIQSLSTKGGSGKVPVPRTVQQLIGGGQALVRTPVEIPPSVKAQVDTRRGYTQATWRWTDSNGVKYEARLHDPTPGAPRGSRASWRVERTFPGDGRGKDPSPTKYARGEQYIGNGVWVSNKVWYKAQEAYKAGTATDGQKRLLARGHIDAE